MGKGRLEDSLKSLSRQLGIGEKVIFTGAVPEGVRYFKAFNSFVLSSDHEPFGMVVLEAIIAELPVTICDTGGAPEVCGDDGLLFPLGDDDALAQRMETLLKLEPEQEAQIVKKLNDRLEKQFTDKAVQDSFWKLPFIKNITK